MSGFVLHEGNNKDGVELGNVTTISRETAQEAARFATDHPKGLIDTTTKRVGLMLDFTPVVLRGADKTGNVVEFAGYKRPGDYQDVTITHIVKHPKDELYKDFIEKVKEPFVVSFDKFGNNKGTLLKESQAKLQDYADTHLTQVKPRETDIGKINAERKAKGLPLVTDQPPLRIQIAPVEAQPTAPNTPAVPKATKQTQR